MTSIVNDPARQRFSELIRKSGIHAVDDVDTFRATLQSAGIDDVHTAALVAVLDAGIASRVRVSAARVPVEAIDQLGEQVARRSSLDPDVARWAVESWVLVLGKLANPFASPDTLIAKSSELINPTGRIAPPQQLAPPPVPIVPAISDDAIANDVTVPMPVVAEPSPEVSKAAYGFAYSATPTPLVDDAEIIPPNEVAPETWPPAPAPAAQTIYENTSGTRAPVPFGITKGFNWGAFLLAPFWLLAHRYWLWGALIIVFTVLHGASLSYLIARLLIGIYIGFSGNRMAWQGRRWDSFEHFKKAQRNWAIAGAAIWGLGLIAIGLLFVLGATLFTGVLKSLIHGH